jgi:Stage II sporulation protein E (SpoIIE)
MPEERSFRFRDALRYSPIAIIGGGIIGFFIGGMRWNPRSIAHGALIGTICFTFAILADKIFNRWLSENPDAWWRRAFVYFVAGQAGWPLGLFLGLPLIWGVPLSEFQMHRRMWAVVFVSGILGPGLGVTVYLYELLKDRLRNSIEQLKEKEFAEKELELARELQARMLPAGEIAADGYRISGRNYAARFVAGDFFDVFPFGDGSIGIAVADVAGKGLAASLIMASVKSVLPIFATRGGVGETIAALNEKLTRELSKREFVALVLARYEPASRRVTFVNAGLPDPYVVRRGGGVEAIEATGPRLPLGLKKNIVYESSEVFLGVGDALLLMSDGLPEATLKSDGEQLGYERMAEIVGQIGARADAIVERVQAETVEVREDDQTIVVLECVE